MSTTNFEDLDPESPEFEAAVEAAQAAEDAEREGTQTAAAEGDSDLAQRQAEEEANNAAASAALAATTTNTEPEKTSKPEGVLAKDGKTVLPWAVVHAARVEKAKANDRAAAAEARAAELEQQLADLKAGKRPEADPLDQIISDADSDFPQLAAIARELKTTREALANSRPEPTKAAAQADDPAEALQDDIDAVPMLAQWQAADPDKFEAAQAMDAALLRSPKWQGQPQVERFKEVARRVAEQFDIQVEDDAPQTPQKTPNKADPRAVIARAARTAPNTLSDFKGGAAATPPDRLDKMAPTQMLRRMEDMTDDELEAHLAKFG